MEEQNPQLKQELTDEQIMEMVMQLLSKKKKLQEAAQEYKVSRETVRKWKNKALEGMKKALTTHQDKGRKPKDYVKDEDLRMNLEEIQRKLEETEKEKKKLEEERRKAVNEMWMARRAIGFIDKNFAVGDEVKKNVRTKQVLKKMFSNVPKKPYGKKEG